MTQTGPGGSRTDPRPGGLEEPPPSGYGENQVEGLPKVEARDLTKTFVRNRHAATVLDRINCSIASGEFVSIVGASGCGKTTLLRILAGIESVSSGEILLDGQRIIRPGPDRGFVFQQDTLFPWRSVLKNVMLGGELQGTPREQRTETARKYIKLVGLSGFENYHPHEISGGMRQRVNLARALALEPDVLLMDEPFAALDAQTREIMQTELLRIWGTARRTVVFVTHQIDEAIFLSDRVIVLTSQPGRIKEIIPVDFSRPRSLSLKRTPEFTAMVDRIWHLIEGEVLKTMDVVSPEMTASKSVPSV